MQTLAPMNHSPQMAGAIQVGQGVGERDTLSTTSPDGSISRRADTEGVAGRISDTHETSANDAGRPSAVGQAAGSVDCSPTPFVTSPANFFTDISENSGIRTNNYDPNPSIAVPINDHSRLAFADLNGDHYDDIVMHSLYPNPRAGIPFEHLVFLNRGDGTFIDWSFDSGLRDVQAGFFAFGDVDNDGDQDVFAGLDIQLTGQTSAIYLNDGAGRFTQLTNAGVEDGVPAAAQAIFADFDSDGRLDLFVGHGHTSFSAPDSLYIGDGTGRFTNASARLQNPPAQPSNGAVACDYDNDGDLDIFVSTYGVSQGFGLNALWENRGSQFINVAVERGFASLPGGNYYLASTGFGEDVEPARQPGTYMGSNGFGIACADVNRDGWMDIFLTAISHPVDSDDQRKWSDPSQLLINQGASGEPNFVNMFIERGLPFNEGDVDGAIIDYDNDGLLDLSISRDSKYERNYPEGEQKAWFGLMRQRADGQFESVGLQSGINAPGVAVQASLTMCSVDDDCTRRSERCLKDRCRRPCQAVADCPEGEICHSGGFCKGLARMKKAQNHAWSDIDLDGDMDLLVGGRDTGGGRPNFLFRNDLGHQNRWLGFRLVGDGRQVNRDAIGAKIRLVFGQETLRFDIQSARGMYNSTDGRIALFGLGDRPCDYRVEVTWPDGLVVNFEATQTGENRHWVVTYPQTLSPLIVGRE
ncbi:MAG: CRTAC1 family protein [Myxococcota bacterium]|nr:CRTAC1 family protein [Myxococcota bacterium]